MSFWQQNLERQIQAESIARADLTSEKNHHSLTTFQKIKLEIESQILKKDLTEAEALITKLKNHIREIKENRNDDE
jgi:hypothetical protein